MEDQETPYGHVALKFSTALLNGQFDEAHALLSASIREEWNPSVLQETYESMVEYFEMPPNEVEVQGIDTEMPYLKSDSAWVYVSIIGEGNGEAVTVIVGNEYGRYLIQDIQWGRP